MKQSFVPQETLQLHGNLGTKFVDVLNKYTLRLVGGDKVVLLHLEISAQKIFTSVNWQKIVLHHCTVSNYCKSVCMSGGKTLYVKEIMKKMRWVTRGFHIFSRRSASVCPHLCGLNFPLDPYHCQMGFRPNSATLKSIRMRFHYRPIEHWSIGKDYTCNNVAWVSTDDWAKFCIEIKGTKWRYKESMGCFVY